MPLPWKTLKRYLKTAKLGVLWQYSLFYDLQKENLVVDIWVRKGGKQEEMIYFHKLFFFFSIFASLRMIISYQLKREDFKKTDSLFIKRLQPCSFCLRFFQPIRLILIQVLFCLITSVLFKGGIKLRAI